MGVLAVLTGAGGVLPLFLKEYLPARKVVGTTVAGCLIMSVPAAATYYMLSAPPAHCGSDCLGPIFLPGMFAAGIASSLTAPFGAWLSHALPPVIRRRAFSALLLIVVANILVKRGSLIAPASLSASPSYPSKRCRPASTSFGSPRRLPKPVSSSPYSIFFPSPQSPAQAKDWIKTRIRRPIA